MTKKCRCTLCDKTVFFVLAFCFAGCSLLAFSQHDVAPYLGQKLPGLSPELFAPGIVSSERSTEYCMTFMPDGREIYFSRGKTGLMVSKHTNSGWSKPDLAAFTMKYPGGEAHIFNNGTRLLMNRYSGLKDEEQKGIWLFTRDCDSWISPRFIISMGMRATATVEGKIYTTDISGFRQPGKDPGIIAIYKPELSAYIRQPDPDGGIQSEIEDAHPFVFPDESALIFNSPRSGGKGKGDLYLCCKRPDGGWGKTVNIEALNTVEADWCATISPDGKYLFFTRNITGMGDIYWVDAQVLAPYKAQSLKE